MITNDKLNSKAIALAWGIHLFYLVIYLICNFYNDRLTNIDNILRVEVLV